jgi:hypothetical protein
LIQPQKNSKTSAGLVIENIVFDRESGKALVIQYPYFDLMMYGSALSFRTDSNQFSQSKLVSLLKCLRILQSLSEPVLEEAVESLEVIAEFYADRLSQTSLPAISASTIKGKLRSAQVAPPIVLEL